MRPVTWYWAQLWEPAHRPPTRPQDREPAAEELPPALASRLARDPAAEAARPPAGARLVAFLGNRAAAGDGTALPSGLRQRLEGLLGADLSSVRVSRHPTAARALAARAFTVGERIVVADGRDLHDRRLLAEEAAHVVQARRRGTRPGLSRRADASERAAAAAGRGLDADELSAGSPVPAVQRDEVPGRAVGPGVLFPDMVRHLLVLEYRRQGSQGPLRWTAELRAGLARLLPAADPGLLAQLWVPPPPGPGVAFDRLAAAGVVPTVGGTTAHVGGPAPAPPRPRAPAGRWSLGRRMGLSGLHLRIGAVPAPPPEAAAVRPYLERGIRLDPGQVHAMMRSRAQAVEQYRRVLASVPGLAGPKLTATADWLADLACDAAVAAEVRAAAPTAWERSFAPYEHLDPAVVPSVWRDVLSSLPQTAPLPELFRLVDDVGISVTIHFDL